MKDFGAAQATAAAMSEAAARDYNAGFKGTPPVGLQQLFTLAPDNLLASNELVRGMETLLQYVVSYNMCHPEMQGRCCLFFLSTFPASLTQSYAQAYHEAPSWHTNSLPSFH